MAEPFVLNGELIPQTVACIFPYGKSTVFRVVGIAQIIMSNKGFNFMAELAEHLINIQAGLQLLGYLLQALFKC